MLSGHGFSLHKNDFCDAVCFCYGWSLSNLPFVAPCLLLTTPLLVLMVVIQPFATMRSETLLLNGCLSFVPMLLLSLPCSQFLMNIFFHRSANTECGACLDVRAQGFWDAHHQCAYFDACVFKLLVATNSQTPSPPASNFMNCIIMLILCLS